MTRNWWSPTWLWSMGPGTISDFDAVAIMSTPTVCWLSPHLTVVTMTRMRWSGPHGRFHALWPSTANSWSSWTFVTTCPPVVSARPSTQEESTQGQRNYAELCQLLAQEGMTSFCDPLVHYNNCDMMPFQNALLKRYGMPGSKGLFYPLTRTRSSLQGWFTWTF